MASPYFKHRASPAPTNWQQPKRVFVKFDERSLSQRLPRLSLIPVFDTIEAADWHTTKYYKAQFAHDSIFRIDTVPAQAPRYLVGRIHRDRKKRGPAEHLRVARHSFKFGLFTHCGELWEARSSGDLLG